MSSARRTRVERGIYRRPDGKLEIGFRDASGIQRWRSIDGGIKAARVALDVERAKRASGEQTPANPRLTFNAAADAWWEAKSPNLRPNSAAIYELHLAHLRAAFGRTRLTAIGSGDVLTWLGQAKRGTAARPPMKRPRATRGTAANTLVKRLRVLSEVFNYASRHLGHPGANPVRALESSERPKTSDSDPRRTLSDRELDALLDAVAPPHRLLFSLLAETGARKSEIAGLVWDDLDLDAMEIHIRRQLARRSEERVEPKTRNSRRTIVITPETARRLREHRLGTGRPGPDALVFRRPNGSPYNFSSIGAAMRVACARAGIEGVSPHNLRHTHASRLIGAGWDVAEVAARLGDTVSTVLSTYVHEWDAARRRQDQRDRLTAIYGSGMEAAERGASRRSQPDRAAESPDLRVIRDAARPSAATGR
jgi:integrase